MVVKEDLEDKAVYQTVQSKQGINQKKFETLAGWRDFSSNSTNKKSDWETLMVSSGAANANQSDQNNMRDLHL